MKIWTPWFAFFLFRCRLLEISGSGGSTACLPELCTKVPVFTKDASKSKAATSEAFLRKKELTVQTPFRQLELE